MNNKKELMTAVAEEMTKAQAQTEVTTGYANASEETYVETYTQLSEEFYKRFALHSAIPPTTYAGTFERNGDKRLHLIVPMVDGEIIKITVTTFEKNKAGSFIYSYDDPDEIKYDPKVIFNTGHIECPELIDEKTRYGLDIWIPKENIETILNGIVREISDINYHLANNE